MGTIFHRGDGDAFHPRIMERECQTGVPYILGYNMRGVGRGLGGVIYPRRYGARVPITGGAKFTGTLVGILDTELISRRFYRP